MPCSACSAGGRVERRLLGRGEGDALAEPDGVEVVEVDVDVADPVVGEVREEREGQVVGAVHRARGVAGVHEADALGLERLPHRLDRGRPVDLADVAGVGLLGRQRVEQVPAGDLVLVGRDERLDHDETRERRGGTAAGTPCGSR